MDLTIMVGGEAGQGVQSVGGLLTKALARDGYQLFADQDYESRVRGGHNFFRIRAGTAEIRAIREDLDLLIALNQESIDLHLSEVAVDGVIVFDSETAQTSGDNALGIPLAKMAKDVAGDKLMANTVAFGAALGVIGYDRQIMASVIKEQFQKKGMGEVNIKAAEAGYQYAVKNFKKPFNHSLPQVASEEKQMLINGNEAISLGAIAAGCTFMAAYPMTPASSIMEYMAGKADEVGLVVIQPEDEIAAVNMAIGAGFAGARAMTATSGSGFCLMVEGLTLAGMTETPLVVIDAQRPGPACGLPTRSEQGDLQFAIHAGHGDFPRAVLAPATAEECFWLTVKAFNLAEKYQTPVTLLTDQHMASSYVTTPKFDLSKVKIDRGQLLHDNDQSNPVEYRHYQVTASGISPRAIPGGWALVVADADEHNQDGHLIEDAKARAQQMSKRMNKLRGLAAEILPPKVYPKSKAQTTLVGWGSTFGAIREAVEFLNREGEAINYVHLSEIWPFPAEAVSHILGDSSRIIMVESNASGQMAELIRLQTGIQPTGHIRKFDGRPFTPRIIIERFTKEFRS